MPRPGLTSAAYRAVQVLPNDSRSRAVLPRVRQRARTLFGGRRAGGLALKDGPEIVGRPLAVGGVVTWGRPGARAVLTGFDPHPAPLPPTIQYPSPRPGYPKIYRHL